MSLRERTIPVTVVGRKSSVDEIGDKIISMLDEIEKRVENLRETAALMEQEKESLIEMLNTVQLNKDMLTISQSKRASSKIFPNVIKSGPITELLRRKGRYRSYNESAFGQMQNRRSRS